MSDQYDPEVRADDPKYSMPDGSYPINNCADVSDAAKLAHHSKKYSFAQVKAMVLKAKAGLNCPDSVLPDTWDEENAAHPEGEKRATPHQHKDADGKTILHSHVSHDAEPGHSHHADGPNGPTGPMLDDDRKRELQCLVRSSFDRGAISLLSTDGETDTGTTLYGHFSRFNQWYEVNSVWEGNFLERVAPGAFAKTIDEDRGSMKVLFDHGMDPAMGNKPLGPIRDLREDDKGAYYEVPLLDTDYNRNFVLPALRGELMDGSKAGSQLGASFQFMVNNDSWDRSGKTSSVNPKGLPRRTITEAQVFEFGPVTFPASGAASAGVRSGTDEFINHLLTDPAFVARLAERSSPRVVQQMIEAANAQGETAPDGEENHQVDSKLMRLRREAEAFLLFGV